MDKGKPEIVGDLKTKTVSEIMELVNRQEKLLSNRKFIEKLPDKGHKMAQLKLKLENELERRNVVAEACDLLANLNLSSLPEDLEWEEAKHNNSSKLQQLDSDDDSDTEVDPLKLIATHSGTVQNKPRKKTLPPEPSLITPKDIIDIEQYSKSETEEHGEKIFNKYVVNLCTKYDKQFPTERFKPNQLKTPETLDASSRLVKEKLGSKWEITAATPPVPIHGPTKLLPLSESLQLQKVQEEKLKEVQLKHATARLAHSECKIGSVLPTTDTTVYRSNQNENFIEDEDAEDEKETHCFDEVESDN